MSTHLLERTNIVIDAEKMRAALKLSGLTTKRAVVDAALDEFVASRQRLSLTDLAGEIEFDPAYDYKATREERS